MMLDNSHNPAEGGKDTVLWFRKHLWKFLLLVWFAVTLTSCIGIYRQLGSEKEAGTVILELPKFIDTSLSIKLFQRYNTTDFKAVVEAENCKAYGSFYRLSTRFIYPYLFLSLMILPLIVAVLPKKKDKNGDVIHHE